MCTVEECDYGTCETQRYEGIEEHVDALDASPVWQRSEEEIYSVVIVWILRSTLLQPALIAHRLVMNGP